ncbi:hypothetical protein DPMN_079676 [Dreissena polymorpha]|uniref:Uncharacterized protein n=1 Tax=Dreissena polymorpha TaxID=45954 RepID=A0A9D3YPG0_DREPO|nr:hypothetical protein DPMN_079676 [Dreissena polymorpha]
MEEFTTFQRIKFGKMQLLNVSASIVSGADPGFLICWGPRGPLGHLGGRGHENNFDASIFVDIKCSENRTSVQKEGYIKIAKFDLKNRATESLKWEMLCMKKKTTSNELTLLWRI